MQETRQAGFAFQIIIYIVLRTSAQSHFVTVSNIGSGEEAERIAEITMTIIENIRVLDRNIEVAKGYQMKIPG